MERLACQAAGELMHLQECRLTSCDAGVRCRQRCSSSCGTNPSLALPAEACQQGSTAHTCSRVQSQAWAQLVLLAAQEGRETNVLEGSSCVPVQYSHGLKMSYSGPIQSAPEEAAHPCPWLCAWQLPCPAYRLQSCAHWPALLLRQTCSGRPLQLWAALLLLRLAWQQPA